MNDEDNITDAQESADCLEDRLDLLFDAVDCCECGGEGCETCDPLGFDT